MEGTRVLVTGGNGFLGSHLVDGLLAAGAEVTVVHRGFSGVVRAPAAVRVIREGIANRGAMAEALQGVEVVYHLAWSGVHVSSDQDLRGHVEANLLPSLSLFETCLDAGVRRVVFVSSGGTVYGIPETVPVPEGHSTRPITAYGVTKLAVERYLELHGRLQGLETVILRPSVAYGERQRPDGPQGAVAIFFGRILRGEPIEIWGDGSNVRDFFHVADFVDACLRVASAPVSGEIFNIAGGRGVRLDELLELLAEASGRRPEVRYTPARGFDVPQIQLDLTKAEELLGWRPRIGLEEGLQRTWDWLRSQEA